MGKANEMDLNEMEKVSGGAGGGDSGPRTHVVKNGETLWGIAVQYYKDGTKWQKIYEANKNVIGSNPDKIMPGMKLQIP